MIEKAKQIKQDYQKIKSWFGHIPSFVPDEFFLIVHSPLLSKKAVATIQPFIEGKIRGFFEDFTEDQLVTTINNNRTLKKQFALFGEKLMELCHIDHWECIDILGKANLSLIEKDGEQQLILIDPHMIYNSKILSERPSEDLKRLTDKINQIERILTRLTIRPNTLFPKEWDASTI